MLGSDYYDPWSGDKPIQETTRDFDTSGICFTTTLQLVSMTLD